MSHSCVLRLCCKYLAPVFKFDFVGLTLVHYFFRIRRLLGTCFVVSTLAPAHLDGCPGASDSGFEPGSDVHLAHHLLERMVQPTESKVFMTSPMTPTTTQFTTWSSYDSHSPSFDCGYNLNGYDQKTALESFSDPPGTPTRTSIDTRQLSWWRASVRKALMKSLAHESRILGAMQVRRTHSPSG